MQETREIAGPETRENLLAGPLREKFFEFFFSKWRILVYCIFLSDGKGSPNVAEPRLTYPLPPPPLDGPDKVR